MQDISPSETGESAIAHDGPLVSLHSPTSYHQDGKEICPNTQVLPTSVSLAKQPKNPVAESKVALEIPATDEVDKRQRSHNGRRKDCKHEQQRTQRREKKINMRRQQVMCQMERVQDSEPTALHTQYQLPEFEFLEIIGSHDMPLDLAGFESMKLSETDLPSTTSTTQISESCPTVASSSTSGQVGITAPHERRSNFTAPIARSVNVQTLAQSDCTVDIFRPNGAIASPFRYFVPPSPPNNISPRPVTASELQALPSILHHRYGLQSMCIWPTCPIVGWHNEGIYLHEGNLGVLGHPTFGYSNPPPYIWQAFERTRQGGYREDDENTCLYFWAFHVPVYIPFIDELLADDGREPAGWAWGYS